MLLIAKLSLTGQVIEQRYEEENPEEEEETEKRIARTWASIIANRIKKEDDEKGVKIIETLE